jgi:hypothetical protein
VGLHLQTKEQLGGSFSFEAQRWGIWPPPIVVADVKIKLTLNGSLIFTSATTTTSGEDDLLAFTKNGGHLSTLLCTYLTSLGSHLIILS